MSLQVSWLFLRGGMNGVGEGGKENWGGPEGWLNGG